MSQIESLRIHLTTIVRDHGMVGVTHALQSTNFHPRIVFLIELAKIAQESKLVIHGFKGYIEAEIESVDDLVTTYSYALKIFGSKRYIPLAIKKGVAQSFNKFSEEQFKQHQEGEISLSDLLRVIHPEPKNEEMSLVFKKILDGTIRLE